jgi:two-component system response regulator AtoC
MSQETPVLLVDDDIFVVGVVEKILRPHGFSVESAGGGEEAIKRVRDGFRGVVVLDRILPDIDGTELLPAFGVICPGNPVIFLTGHGSVDLAVDSIRDGAFEFLDKSELMDRLLPSVEAAAARFREQEESERLLQRGLVHTSFREIITESREMQAVFRALRNALESNVTVLIQGESGTGKELVARAVHDYGPRSKGPFLALNCAGIPENLLEAEIFGYERGAFTGAQSRKPGKFEAAQEGTLLLDEVGDMHPALQAKLLRLLQSGEFQRLGGVETLYADVRVLSSTNRNLEREIETGDFRRDLYYRLAVFTVYLPPLRERKGDIRVLAEHFLREFAEKESKLVEGIDRNAMLLLESYAFPGNIRELQNILTYAVISSRGKMLTIADFPPNFLRAVSLHRKASKHPLRHNIVLPEPPVVYMPDRAEIVGRGHEVVAEEEASVEGSLSRVSPEHFPSLAELELSHIEKALRLCRGNKSAAARMLGISRVTLYRKLAGIRAKPS